MTWNLDPPPGFQGLHPDKPVTMYRRHLPHLGQPGATYFITSRQGDSLPREKLDELNSLRADWEHRHPPHRSDQQLDELWRESFRRVDRWLDECAGSCHLRDPRASQIVTDSLHYFDEVTVHGILRLVRDATGQAQIFGIPSNSKFGLSRAEKLSQTRMALSSVTC